MIGSLAYARGRGSDLLLKTKNFLLSFSANKHSSTTLGSVLVTHEHSVEALTYAEVEYYCARLLRERGFSDVVPMSVTPLASDSRMPRQDVTTALLLATSSAAIASLCAMLPFAWCGLLSATFIGATLFELLWIWFFGRVSARA